ncbi:MAG: endonuclease domain-containing protein [Flavobacteriaceae bacterium]|nr:endonuclease domain-containing protein [Flavobacteriaceae bacterium]
MWRGASPTVFSKANKLRNEMTKSEILLSEKLRANQLLGYKFRRQHPISIYVADFYCHQLSLIIEIDGEYHNEKNQIIKDEERRKDLNFQGMKILRFTNNEVITDIDSVLNKIKDYINDVS